MITTQENIDCKFVDLSKYCKKRWSNFWRSCCKCIILGHNNLNSVRSLRDRLIRMNHYLITTNSAASFCLFLLLRVLLARHHTCLSLFLQHKCDCFRFIDIKVKNCNNIKQLSNITQIPDRLYLHVFGRI